MEKKIAGLNDHWVQTFTEIDEEPIMVEAGTFDSFDHRLKGMDWKHNCCDKLM